MARSKKKFNTIGMDGVMSNSQLQRKQQRLAAIPDDLEIERDILEARNNKKARQDAAEDMLLDAIRKSGGKRNKKGRV